MTHNGKRDRASRDPIAVWEVLLDDVAEQAAEDYVPTDDDIQWSREVATMVKGRIAELRRQLTPAQPTVRRGVGLPPDIQALDRESLLARLESLRQRAEVRYAHQDLTGLSVDDLRTVLALLVAPAER